MNQSAEAIRILDANINVPYGIFSIIDGSGYFPPLAFLNAFLLQGSDPCDQDGRMGTWRPFALTSEEYATVKKWWFEANENAVVADLGCACWDEWVQEILNN
ncbi:hypothetical protein HF650_08135 [Kosakonia sp. SMBL-WEM22]|uniref:hypothetical protein n=1 Tax=Kosakonia sp. SMBL-WEM22 TaxID=2725560 RepID=UPI001658E0B6|nr:hypothetical protein [Kosakonia sp. SMBL-WEM22]QNQ19727.1 hypothetical protein HF650_08135 [Kosakonia sp. SMBL-WEM22]